jgi:hypothetical protein
MMPYTLQQNGGADCAPQLAEEHVFINDSHYPE